MRLTRFGDQPDADNFKQLGNGVSVGAVRHVLRQHVRRDAWVLDQTSPGLLAAVTG